MPIQSINGANLSYHERGLPSSPPLVLVHGFPLDGRMWDAQLAALSDRYRVIVPDQRGFGQSRSDDRFSMASLAEDLHALLSRLKALPCTLGALSMGGYVALEFVKKFPADLKALILIDTRAEADNSEGRANRDKMIELAKTKGAKAVAEQMMPKMLAEVSQKTRPQVVSQLRTIMESCPATTIQNASAAMRDRADHTADLPSIPIPTLILVGDADAITPPKMAEQMHRDIPRSTLTIIPQAGHMSPMEQPQAVTGAIRGFLQNL